MSLAVSTRAHPVPVDTTSSRGSSSAFASARSHWPYEPRNSSRLNLSGSDSSDDNTTGDTFPCSESHQQSEDSSRIARSPDSQHVSSHSDEESFGDVQDEPNEECATGLRVWFNTSIRQHGAPLDTITERTSVSTIRETPLSSVVSLCGQAWHSVNRKSSAPEPPTFCDGQRDPRLTKSLDEAILEGYDAPLKLEVISEAVEGLQRDSTAIQVESSAPTEARILMPTERPHHLPEGSTTSSSSKAKVDAHRRTSAYVRSIYRKLVRASQHDVSQSDMSEVDRSNLEDEKNTVEARYEPTEIPNSYKVLHNIGNNHLQVARWGDSEVGLGGGTQRQEHMLTRSQRGDSNDSTSNSAKDESENILGKPTSRLPNILAKTSRIFGSPKTWSPAKKSTTPYSPSQARTAGNSQIKETSETIVPQSSLHNSAISICIAGRTGDAQASKCDDTRPSLVKPYTIRNRSIFDICATEVPEARDVPEGPSHQQGPCGNILSIRNSLSGSQSTTSTPSSWDLPLAPFPRPPSPHYFVTPPTTMKPCNETQTGHHASDGSAVDLRFAPRPSSGRFYVSKADTQSLTTLNSSTSLVSGEAMSPKTLEQFLIDYDDPFFSGHTGPVLDSTDAADAVFKTFDISTTPIHMPSPLHPMSKSNTRYSLFPSENGYVTSFASSSQKVPNSRFRSLSSMLRLPSDTMRASKSSVIDESSTAPCTCEHGKPVEVVGVFSGRKLGSRAWRLRHWLRDGGERCWRCTLKRTRARLREYGAGVSKRLGRRQSPGLAQQINASAAARYSSDAESHAPPRVMHARDRAAAVPHPLEKIENHRASRDDGHLDGSAPLVRVISFVDRWATWAPKQCFCQNVEANNDSASSLAIEKLSLERRATKSNRVAPIRRVID